MTPETCSEDAKFVLVKDILGFIQKLYTEALVVPQGLLETEITMPQLQVLLLLRQHGPLSMGIISKKLCVGLATLTGIVDRLVRQGFVERETPPDNRRVVICHLTPKGNDHYQSLWQFTTDKVAELLDGVDNEGLSIIRNGFCQLEKSIANKLTAAESTDRI
ncbi:MarR family winged helix-turn-helix transcriptional regulator [Dehalococcoides mccartyi]|uniref:Transcriptional regulator, MarR family n=1 Tax=Dehalococcoides mccartyi (strain ATCC BAA-2266 / KCTC 15142 / 195) TaxID=243164 RepID=Q3Z852_DEHM1|nr:MarR family transcriptional regulator [Dehalococcoides mccartyi]AAW39855.1 transcriptional regulator, MarR family [Dehalococcoides mccartyi 195]